MQARIFHQPLKTTAVGDEPTKDYDTDYCAQMSPTKKRKKLLYVWAI